MLPQCGNYGNSFSRKFGKNFVKITVLLNKLLSKELIWRNIFYVRENFSFFHTACSTLWKNEKFSLIEKIFRQINSLVFYLVKTLLSRNFCQKSVKLFRLNFYNFHTVPRTLWNAKVEFCNHIFFRENIFLSFIFT